MFSKQTYIDRRNTLKKQVQSGVILLLGNEDCGMNYAANTFPFRQDSSFLYYFGLDYAGLTAILDIDQDDDIIFGNDITIDDIVWMGKQPSIHDKAQYVGVTHTLPESQIAPYLQKALSQNRVIHFLPPYRCEHTLKLQEWLGIAPREQGEKSSFDLKKAIVNQRIYKSDEEIEHIESAVTVSNAMHEVAIRQARPGMKEYEVAALMEAEAKKRGCTLSFPIICTIHGETLHNYTQSYTLKSGDMLLLDAGAEDADHYCGDISSTLPVDRTFTSQQKLIYRITEMMHQTAVDALIPGRPYKEIYYQSCGVMVEQLKALGLMKGNVDEALAAGAHALFMPCGTGHTLGLDVHDMENLGEFLVGYNGKAKSTQFGIKYLRLARPLEPRFVLTVEPGMYFIPDLIDMWQQEKRHESFINYSEVRKFIGFGGIRNEENYLIEDHGARRLGSYLPRTAEETEAWR